MTADDDGTRWVRIDQVDQPSAATPPPKRKSPGAQAAARYRARKRGGNAPKRKPGPKPATAVVLRQQIADLERRLNHSELIRRQLTEQVSRLSPQNPGMAIAEPLDLSEWK